MHDGISLETLGRPTVVVVTEVFLHEAHVQRAALGMEALQPLVIAHPLSTLTEEEIGQRIATVVAQAPAIWRGL
jgi:hypothetical protein